VGSCKLTSAGRPFGSLTRGLVGRSEIREDADAGLENIPASGRENVLTRDYRRSSLEAPKHQRCPDLQSKFGLHNNCSINSGRRGLTWPGLVFATPSALRWRSQPSPSSSLPASDCLDQRHAQPRGHGLQHAACSFTTNEGR
jgi:hypothetical protein